MLDARAPLQLVLRELGLLVADPGRAVGVWSGGAVAASAGAGGAEAAGPAGASRSFRVAESDVGKVIGKGGSAIKALRQLSGAAVTLAERGGGKAPAPRLLVLSGAAEAVELGTKLLVELCPAVIVVV